MPTPALGPYCDPGANGGRAFAAGSYRCHPPGTEHRAGSPAGSGGYTILVWAGGRHGRNAAGRYIRPMRSAPNPLASRRLRDLLEPALWLAALAFLFCADPGRPAFSLCLFKLVGFGHCPGCGLGRAMHHALHLDFRQAWQAHALGVPAAGLLLYRSLTALFVSPQPSPAWTRTTYS